MLAGELVKKQDDIEVPPASDPRIARLLHLLETSDGVVEMT